MFSVIMPVYNGEKFIDSAIQSVFAQSEPDWELIIVDDGSGDGTRAVLEKYQNTDKVRIITQTNHGAAAARNRAAGEARGTHLTFLDADDLWYENHLSVMKTLIEKYPSAGLYGTFTETRLQNGASVSECEYLGGNEDILLEDFFDAYHKDKSVKLFTMITTCIPRAAFERAGGFPEGCAIGEDLELSLRVAAYYPVALSGLGTALYQKENSTATQKISFDPEWRFFDTVRDIYKDETISNTKRENLKKVMEWFTMRRCRHYLIAGQRKKAWRAFCETDRSAVAKKDIGINLMLLVLPCGVVRRIFSMRWKGKA
ncbi:MAG: glycosyltransferase [Oscillospiraceae bacterium]|nr:glycosyltransferase [Oscillospiraceae bacterium]